MIERQEFLLGTYTTSGGSGLGVGWIDAATGRPEVGGWNRAVADPSWVEAAAGGRTLYAVGELTPDGMVSALRPADPGQDGGSAPVLLNTVATGAKPAHLTVHPGGRVLFAALYDGGGVAVHPIEPDGSLGPVSEVHLHADPGRPALAHAHQVVVDPIGDDVLVVDLGTDSIHRYRWDPDRERLVPSDPVRLAAGSGPRHLVFHPSGSHAYVAGELDSTVTVCERGANGLSVTAVLPAIPADLSFSGPNYPGEIVVSADGRFVYVTNRGSNTIAVFAVGADGHKPDLLVPVAVTGCGGDWPRHLAIDRTGRWLYVANERSGDLVWFPLDASGVPGPLAGRLAVPGIAQFCLPPTGPHGGG